MPGAIIAPLCSKVISLTQPGHSPTHPEKQFTHLPKKYFTGVLIFVHHLKKEENI